MLVNCLFSDRTPKESESITDCQDYFEISEAKRCFAIADGASQSFYSAIWAELLVQHFCENPEISDLNWKDWLEPIQKKWLIEVKNRVKTAKSQGKSTWIEGYNGLTAKKSATSTFIGLQFNEDKIKACIVGDSCLFIFRNGKVESYPLKHSEDFNDRPEYLASYPKDNHFQPNFLDISLEQSDNASVILATDALSEYLLKCLEQKQDVFPSLLKISSKQHFESFVALARHQTIVMKNDDVTLLILSYSFSSPQNISQSRINSVASGSSIALSVQNNSKTYQKTDYTSDSNPKKNWFNLIKHKLSSLPAMSQGREHVIPDPISVLSKKVNYLKQQRAILAILVTMMILLNFLSFLVGRIGNKLNQSTTQTIANSSSNAIARPTQFLAGSVIYSDQELRQPFINLVNSSEVLILEEGDKWIKFQIELYAHKTIINPCPSCSNNEIEILSAKNLRVFPGEKPEDIFGQLNRNTKFQKSEFKSLPNWHKFRFVGYITK